MHERDPRNLLKPLYDEISSDLPICPKKLGLSSLETLRSADVASRAFGLPLVWAVQMPDGQLSFGANETRLALLILQQGHPLLHEHVRDHAHDLGVQLAQDVASGVHNAGPALLEDLQSAPEDEVIPASTEDRARVHQLAHAAGLDYGSLAKLLLGRTLH